MTSRIIKPVATSLVVLAFLFSLGFRVAHPKDGLKNALGSAHSTLVIYRNGSGAEIGSKVISNVDAPAKSPVLAIVRANTQTTADILIGRKLVRVKRSQITGRLLAVVPFLGSIVGLVGL